MDKMPIEFLDEEKDEPPMARDDVFSAIGWFCSGVLFISACFAAGLYFGYWK